MDTPKHARELPCTVLEAAKARIKHSIDLFDDIVVSCSGGKDSMVLLYMVEEVYKELGITRPINVRFNDEELIPEDIVNFVLDIAKRPQIKLFYLAVPLESSKLLMGTLDDYVQWDNNREWIRPKPECAITELEGQTKDTIYNQYILGDYFANTFFKGKKICELTGVRAAESIQRLRSVMSNPAEPHINRRDNATVGVCRPIYDWSEKDVFRYFYDVKEPYCTVYDHQTWQGEPHRVASALTPERCKKSLGKVKTTSPLFWKQIISVFPEAEDHVRYYKSLKKSSIEVHVKDKEPTFKQIYKDLDKMLSDGSTDRKMYELLTKTVKSAQRRRSNNLKKGLLLPFGGFPLLELHAGLLGGSLRRGANPTYELDYAKAMFDFEGISHLWDKHNPKNAK